MNEILAGRLLVASPLLVDPNFARTVVLVLEQDTEGALGVVLNRPSAVPVLDHVPTWSGVVPDPEVVFIGGPVEPQIAVGLVTGEGAQPTSLDGLGIGDLHETPPLGTRGRVFSGYAGWDAGQLEHELVEQAWMVVDACPDDVFAVHPDRLWRDVLKRQQGLLALLSSYPVDPRQN